MKKILSATILLIFCISVNFAQDAVKKNDPTGKWKFEAPYAPDGFTTGTIEVGFKDNKYSAIISFTGNDYKIPGDKVKVENDTVDFSVSIEGTDVSIKLKMQEATKMSGTASTYEGEIPLTLTREVSVN